MNAGISPGIRIMAPNVADFARLAWNMRADEIEQFLALTGMPAYDPDIAARCFIATPGLSFCLVGTDDNPIVAGGYEQIRPKVWQTWMVGTQAGWDQHWRAITKACRRQMDEMLASGQAQRFQCLALASRLRAHEWYARGLKMEYEGTFRQFFANGADAVSYARVKEAA